MRPLRLLFRGSFRSLVAVSALLALLALPALPALAATAGVQVTPGLWEFTSSLPDPLAGQAGNQVYRTCVRDRTITPQSVMARHKECRIWNAVVAGPSAKWKMRCDTPAGPMNGSGSLRTNGSAVAGSVEMTMAVGALEIPISGAFRGRRVGNCR